MRPGFVDLFCGAGGAGLGLKRAGLDPLLGIDKYFRAVDVYILGIYDRREFFSHEKREELIQWLDAHPNRWTIEFQKAEGYWISLREVLANPDN
jgi:site-specific DNA-cytosine methylase